MCKCLFIFSVRSEKYTSFSSKFGHIVLFKAFKKKDCHEFNLLFLPFSYFIVHWRLFRNISLFFMKSSYHFRRFSFMRCDKTAFLYSEYENCFSFSFHIIIADINLRISALIQNLLLEIFSNKFLQIILLLKFFILIHVQRSE